MPLDAGGRELPLQVRASVSTLRSKRSAAFETQQSEPDTRPCQFTQIGNHLALTQWVKHPVIRDEQHAASFKNHKGTLYDFRPTRLSPGLGSLLISMIPSPLRASVTSCSVWG